MKNMKIVVPLCFFLISICFGLEDATSTKSEQQLKVQKREKQYLIEDDSNAGPEQKRDERQSNPVKNNHHNLDANGNSRTINIRLQPQPNIVTVPKQVIKPEVLPKRDTTPQRIPTKIPVVLKTVKVVPGPAHAIRMKILQNKINETINANKEKALCENNGTPTNPNKDSIPCFTMEDKDARRTDSGSSPNNNDGGVSNHENNATPRTDDKETPSNTGTNQKDNDDEQVPSNSDKGTSHKNNENPEISETVKKPVHFYVDEPDPLPPSFRRQQIYEHTAFQNKEVTPTKSKKIPIARKGKFNTKDESRQADCENDENNPGIVKISNGTHVISIENIQNSETHKAERNGEEITVPTEERIVNQPLPEPKPVVDEPEKHTFSTEKFNIGRDKSVVLPGLVFKDNKLKEDKDKNNCNTVTNHKHEGIEEEPLISPPITFQPAYPPTYNAVVQDSWNYLQNPYFYHYYQNIYDQYRRNSELAQSTPNIYGQDNTYPRKYGAQINPYMPSQQNIDLSGSPITLPHYPNGIPATDTDLTQYPYSPNTYDTQSKIAGSRRQFDAENRVPADGVWRSLKCVGRSNKIDDIDEPEIDIRRSFDGKTEGYTVDVIGKVANPYPTTSLPITVNGALVYPYRYMR